MLPKKKFVVERYYQWQMSDLKETKIQIIEYQKFLEDLNAEEISLAKFFSAGVLIPELWNDYKNNLKHKQTNFSVEK